MKLSYARQALHDATAIGIRSNTDTDQVRYGCKIQNSTSSSADNRIVDGIEAGRILKAAESGGHIVYAWLMFAYSAMPEMVNDAPVRSHVAVTLFSKESRLRQYRIVGLIDAAMHDYRMRMTNGRSLPSAAYCANMLGEKGKPLDESLFVEDGWSKMARDIHRLLEDLDRTGVTAVAEEVRILNGDQERERVLKPVTNWYRGTLDKEGVMHWEHNHREDGHVEDAMPRPIYIEQVKSWRGADGWKKEFGYQGEDGQRVQSK